MHRRFWGHTCATTYQLRPFPKDLFALQSAYIPVHWVYLENIILTSRRAAALPKQIKMKEFLGHKVKHSVIQFVFVHRISKMGEIKEFFSAWIMQPLASHHTIMQTPETFAHALKLPVWLKNKPDNKIIWLEYEMSKCGVGACRLTSIRRLVKPPALSKSDYLKYITQWKLPWQLQVSLWPSLSPFRFSLTLPHNTNLHCMSQLGALTDATHNP